MYMDIFNALKSQKAHCYLISIWKSDELAKIRKHPHNILLTTASQSAPWHRCLSMKIIQGKLPNNNVLLFDDCTYYKRKTNKI